MKVFFKWVIGNKKIKRWILLIILGMVLTCYAFSQVLVIEKLELIELLKIIIEFVVGFTCFILGLVYMHRRTLEIAANPEIIEKNTEENKINSKGPKVVVIGGGNGLSAVLKGLKKYTNNITAIVTVSTYGKESNTNLGEDIKLSLEALAENSEEMNQVLSYEYTKGKLKGLNFGDIYLQAMQDVYGDFAKSIEKSSDIFAMIGKVLPVTLDEMHICVELDNGMVIEDKEKIADITTDKVTKINRVFLSPSNCKVSPGVIEAIQDADAIIIGPGSLYTNVIPNLLIRNVAKTIRESNAFKIYIPNIMTQPGHTDDYYVSDHINAIIEHAGPKIVEYCICDNGDIIPEFLRKYNKEGSDLVEVDSNNLKGKGIRIVKDDISYIDGEHIRHNPEELARVIFELICTELKFKDKQTDEQYLLLNSKLKEEKKKNKNKIINKNKPKKEKVKRGASKFSTKYRERIKSIQSSEETKKENIKIQQIAEEITTEEEQKEKEKFLKETYQKKK